MWIIVWRNCSNLFLDRRRGISYLMLGFFLQISLISMISSMTGYGKGEQSRGGTVASAEVRSVNSRYLEVASRLPRSISIRENDIKELVRAKFTRGKISVVIAISQDGAGGFPVRVNAAAAKGYVKMLTDLRRSIKSREKITLDHLLKFPEVLEVPGTEEQDEAEWSIARDALMRALDETAKMRDSEGKELSRDLVARVNAIESSLTDIERLAAARIPEERKRLLAHVGELVADPKIIDANRLELELVLLADRLDVTEECVRFRSHNKFFLNALQHEEGAGRKLNFLIQEMNREANTIGSKANDADIAHLVVAVKEELEKIREQLQNIE